MPELYLQFSLYYCTKTWKMLSIHKLPRGRQPPREIIFLFTWREFNTSLYLHLKQKVNVHSVSVLRLVFIEVLGCCWVTFMTFLVVRSHSYCARLRAQDGSVPGTNGFTAARRTETPALSQGKGGMLGVWHLLLIIAASLCSLSKVCSTKRKNVEFLIIAPRI